MPVELPPVRRLPDPERMLREILADDGYAIDDRHDRRRNRRGPIVGGVLVAAAALAVTAIAVPAVLHHGGTIASSPSASPRAPTPGHLIMKLGDTAQFDRVTVTVRRIDLHPMFGVLVDVKMCGRPSPADASGNNVPISWASWTIVNGEGQAGASLRDGGPVPKPTNLLPKEASLRAGHCVDGLVPFNADEHSQVISVRYADAQGDTAVWAAG